MKSMSEYEFEERAIPFIEVDEASKFTVSDEARRILGQLEGKICVISVAGLYRTGKSSLVNFLLERQTGFTVGPTINRCTRGIWFWGTPRRGTLPSGEQCWVVLLDTEGLGGLEADVHYDTRIFSLATLLCSTLVYNSLGSIDENAINNLSFVANLAQHIKVHKDMGDEVGAPARADDADAHEFHKFFPSFVWVVRDFSLTLVDDHDDEISADQYLERALAPQVGFDAQTTERNRVRQMMTAFFTERKCIPLVRPLLDEATLQEIDKVPFDDLRVEFQRDVHDLRRYLYESHLRPKTFSGRPIERGAAFVALAEQFVAAISEGGVPTMTSAWEEVMRRECEDALAAALNEYEPRCAACGAGAPTTRRPRRPPPPTAAPTTRPRRRARQALRRAHGRAARGARGLQRARGRRRREEVRGHDPRAHEREAARVDREQPRAPRAACGEKLAALTRARSRSVARTRRRARTPTRLDPLRRQDARDAVPRRRAGARATRAREYLQGRRPTRTCGSSRAGGRARGEARRDGAARRRDAEARGGRGAREGVHRLDRGAAEGDGHAQHAEMQLEAEKQAQETRLTSMLEEMQRRTSARTTCAASSTTRRRRSRRSRRGRCSCRRGSRTSTRRTRPRRPR